jgi:penicillin-binding protein-related factor A (putative recombinase)
VKRRLDAVPNLYYFVKEALALRGIPDIIGCYQGRFFAWELKRSKKEAQKKTGRIVLQRHILKIIRKAGGIGEVVHPDNLEEKLEELTTHCKNPTTT